MKIVDISVPFVFGRMTRSLLLITNQATLIMGITLKEAKSNFSKFGACEKEMSCYVRSPRDDEKEIS